MVDIQSIRRGMPMSLKEMFDDQKLFNRQIWNPDKRSQSESMDRLRHLSLGMVEETLEFLRTYEWKAHRKRRGHLQNVAHSHEELVDSFKYWLCLADLADFPIDKIEELYYAKSRVVQYRYQEEWLKTIDRPCVVIDIDNVLADYITGICEWAREWGPKILNLTPPLTLMFIERLSELRAKGEWFNASTIGIGYGDWEKVRHGYRTSGAKRTIPVFPGAKPFLDWCRSKGWIILLITSRPVDRYPNIFTDTLTWLTENQLPFDQLWWADEKARQLEEYEHVALRANVVFAVDDMPKFISQYRSKGVKAYWLNRHATNEQMETDPTTVRAFTEIMSKEGDGDGVRRCET